MSTSTTSLPRRMVPRWRDFSTAAALGECQPSHKREMVRLQYASHQDISDLWVTYKTTALAAELLSVALVEGDLPEAEEASRYLLAQDDASPIAKDLARYFLSEAVAAKSGIPSACESGNKQVEISGLRHALREYPNDALAWCELSRWYSIAGSNDRARRAMLTAIGISEPVRYVLRSAIRCFLHLGEQDLAYKLAHRSPLVRRDPWVAAAAISTSLIIGKSPRYYKIALSMAKSESLSLFQRSELSAALGTLHLGGGNSKRAVRAFSQALRSPTENVIAQVSWADYNKHMKISLPAAFLEMPFAFEAETFDRMQDDDWDGALDASNRWICDERFAGRPAVQNAFIRSVAYEDFDEAISVLIRASRTNVADPRILNNLAFCYASIGDTKNARRVLRQAEYSSPDEEMTIIIGATNGLALFREGKVEEGRSAYHRAMEMAVAGRLKSIHSHAAFFLAKEEKRAESAAARSAEGGARELLEKAPDPASRLMLRILREGSLQLPKNENTKKDE